MSLKLIREAALASTLSKAELQALSIIKDAVGKTSILDVVSESFAPSADDFDAWMRVVVGEAQDRGVNLNKKAEFMQLVMDVLENDPANPPFDMQEIIANKMWQDYKAAKHEVRLNKMSAANEEEEKVEKARKQIAARFAQGPTSVQSQTMSDAGEEEEQMGISDDLAATKIFNKIKGTPNLSFVNVERYVAKYAPMVGKKASDVKYIATLVYDALQNAGMEEEESGFAQAFKSAMGTEEEEPSFVRDAIKDGSSMKGSFSGHLRGDDEDLEDAEFTSTDSECECPCPDEDLDAEDFDDKADANMDPPSDEFDDNTMDDVDADVSRKPAEKSYDEEEAVKSFFRQAATAPRNMMTQAIKDIEGEGKSAWTSSNVPKNPHPHNSAAYRAWQRGMLAAAKDALGIVDKAKDPKAKPKKKK